MRYLVCDDAIAPRESAAIEVSAGSAQAAAESRLATCRAGDGARVAVRVQGQAGPWIVFVAEVRVSAREVGRAADSTIRYEGP